MEYVDYFEHIPGKRGKIGVFTLKPGINPYLERKCFLTQFTNGGNESEVFICRHKKSGRLIKKWLRYKHFRKMVFVPCVDFDKDFIKKLYTKRYGY